MTRDYKEDIKIDERDLEHEWLEQPSLFLYYAEAHADAMHERDLAKSKADYTYAIMYSDVKKNWEKYFDSKPTEPAIKEYIISNPRFRKAEKLFLNAAHHVNAMLAAKTAFDHRKRALENLVSLRISGFHSEPRNKTRKIREKGGHKTQKQNLNKRKRLRATSRKTTKN